MAVQPDGKIVAAGLARIGTNDQFAVLRYNTDGSTDNSYGAAGQVLLSFTDFGSDDGGAVALDQIGRPVVVGNANNVFGVARLQSEPCLKFLSIARLANGHVQLHGLGVPETNNTLSATTNLSLGNFTPLGFVIPDADGSWNSDDATAVGLPCRFYRLSFP